MPLSRRLGRTIYREIRISPKRPLTRNTLFTLIAFLDRNQSEAGLSAGPNNSKNES
jgi:hypothetical protein